MSNELNTILFHWFHSGAGKHPVIDLLAVFMAESGPYIIIACFFLFWLGTNRHEKTIFYVVSESTLLGLLINFLIGLLYFHPRPYMVNLGSSLIPQKAATSFPSAHSTTLFASSFSLLLQSRWSREGLFLLGFSLFCAWSEVYTGIHFPFDILGSVFVATVSALVILMLQPGINSWQQWLLRSITKIKTLGPPFGP